LGLLPHEFRRFKENSSTINVVHCIKPACFYCIANSTLSLEVGVKEWSDCYVKEFYVNSQEFDLVGYLREAIKWGESELNSRRLKDVYFVAVRFNSSGAESTTSKDVLSSVGATQ
jgi:hypothetical protein